MNIPMLMLVLLQTSRRRQMDDSFQSAFIVGYFIGGMLLTRIVSWVVRFVLVKILLRGKYVLSAVIGHAFTFVFCAVGLWVMLSTQRQTFSTSSGTVYRETSEYPVQMLLIYTVCIAIWFGVDLLLAKWAERRALARATRLYEPAPEPVQS